MRFPEPFLNELQQAFAAHADAQRAAPMQAYMKSTLPFYGIQAPLRRQLTAAIVKRHPAPSTSALGRAMRTLWNRARFREERYAAAELARVGSNAKLLHFDLLPIYELMIRDGAWWDYCDEISGNALARLLEQHPRQMKPVLRRWAKSDDMWLRRAAFLCQRRLRIEVDTKLLYDCIRPSIGAGKFAGEFFIRKGIGWALRERSYQAPDEVIAFCTRHDAALAPLTQREALKVIQRGKKAGPKTTR